MSERTIYQCSICGYYHEPSIVTGSCMRGLSKSAHPPDPRDALSTPPDPRSTLSLPKEDAK